LYIKRKLSVPVAEQEIVLKQKHVSLLQNIQHQRRVMKDNFVEKSSVGSQQNEF